jgi:hypothetical protein
MQKPSDSVLAQSSADIGHHHGHHSRPHPALSPELDIAVDHALVGGGCTIFAPASEVADRLCRGAGRVEGLPLLPTLEQECKLAGGQMPPEYVQKAGCQS